MASELAELKYVNELGETLTVPLNEAQMKKWFECFSNQQPFMEYVNNEFIGVNTSRVVNWTISDVTQDLESLGGSEQTNISDEKPTGKKNTLFKIECKCGKDYTHYNHSRSTKYYCRHCNEIVFVDYDAGKIQTPKGAAWLMTNRRFVVRQPHPDDVTKPYSETTVHENSISSAIDKWRKKIGM